MIILDYAPYHTSKTTLRMFQQLQLPICFTGPHSYDASPIELWFAAFKSKDINPRHVKTSKGHFKVLSELVMQRAQMIEKHTVILFWHHCLLEAYRYLSFERL